MFVASSSVPEREAIVRSVGAIVVNRLEEENAWVVVINAEPSQAMRILREYPEVKDVSLVSSARTL